MKRKELKRKTPLSARKPMQRRCRETKRGLQRDARWRSEPYLKWIRSLPCSYCGTTRGVVAHHVIGIWNMSGMGLKAPDSFAMPACDGPGDTCHRKIHASKTLQALQPQWIEQTIRQAIADGASVEMRYALLDALAYIHAKEEN